MTWQLQRLGLEYVYLLRMRTDLLTEFKRKTNDLIHQWSAK